MRVHLLALPNVQTTSAYDLDGFCQMTIKFARVLKELGHTVFLYASEENDAPCDELITVITKEEQETLLEATFDAVTGLPCPTPYQYAYIEEWSPIWQLANARMVKEIRKRKQPRDLIASIGGASQKMVATAHQDLMFVEYSIGYQGSFSQYRVFESEAWKHYTYGSQGINDTRFLDAVIPCCYDPTDFPFTRHKEPFALYVGRLIPRKGLEIACKAAYMAGVPLKAIGHGEPELLTHGAEYLGALPNVERNAWLSRASVVIIPTIYIEPFNQVGVEAQLCGTPVVATEQGGFTETIEHGKTGYRCGYLGEFATALRAESLAKLDPHYIRDRAVSKYSIDAVKPQYQQYFDRLALLWDDGFNTGMKPLEPALATVGG